jgi:hypothetical protein
MSRASLVGAVALLAVASSMLSAQTSISDPVDVQGWYGGALRLDLPKKWDVIAQYRLRTVDNASQIRGSYLTGEVRHTPISHLTLIGSYRLALVDNGTFHRYAAGTQLSAKGDRSSVSLRGLVQYQRQNFSDNDEQASDTDAFLRSRLELEHRLSDRFGVYASTEPYVQLGAIGDDARIDNWRNTVGVKWKYAKRRSVDLFYIYRPDYGRRTYNRSFHIVGVDLDFTHKIGGGKP